MKKYILVIGKTQDGKVEYQVSDGEPYNGKNNKNERSHSYDFTNKEEANKMLRKLNKEVK